jgi:hypothetical protein
MRGAGRDVKRGVDIDTHRETDSSVDVVSRPSGPSPLEARYRRLLRVLPAGYRAVREQEMVEAFVQASVEADPELADLTLQAGWPGLRESASVLRLALRLRWADPQAPRRYRVRAAGLRAATVASLTVLAVTAAQSALSQVWFALAPTRGIVDGSPAYILFGADPDVWSLVRGWAFVLWIPALILSVLGGRRGAGWAIAIAAIPTAVTVIAAATGPVVSVFGIGGLALAVVQVAVIAGLAGMASARVDNTVHHRRRWLLAAAVGFVAWAVPIGVSWLLPTPRALSALDYVGYVIVDTAGFWFGATVVAVAMLVMRRLRGTQVSTAALLGLAGLAGAATVLRASTVPVWIQYAHENAPGTTPIMISTVIQLGCAAAIALTATTLAAIRIRALPPASYLPAGPAVTT